MGPSYWHSSVSSFRMWHVSRVSHGSTGFFFRFLCVEVDPVGPATGAGGGGGGGGGDGTANASFAMAAIPASRFSVARLIDIVADPPSVDSASRAADGRYTMNHTTATWTAMAMIIAMPVVRLRCF